MMKGNKLAKYMMMLLISMGLLTACDDTRSHTISQPNNIANADQTVAIDTALDKLTDPAKVGITLPPEPTDEQAKTTLTGVDSNHNQVRDDIEHIIYQSVSLLEQPITATEYQQTLDLIKYIQPTNDTSQSINQHTFYCKYISLPEKVKQELSMGFLQFLVTDTKDRKENFYQKFIPSSSTGKEICTNSANS